MTVRDDIRRPSRTTPSRTAPGDPNPVARPSAVRPARPLPPVRWGRALLTLAALATAFAGMHVVLQDLSWWLVGTGFAALVLGAAAVTRVFLSSRWIPPLVGIGASVLGVTAGFAGDASFLGLLPTFGSGNRINSILNAGWESIQEQRVPAQPDTGIVLLLVFTMIGCAVFADAAITIARAPALVAAPLLTLLGIPVAVRPDIADPLWFVITAVLLDRKSVV